MKNRIHYLKTYAIMVDMLMMLNLLIDPDRYMWKGISFTKYVIKWNQP